MREKIIVKSMIDEKVFWDFSYFNVFGLSWQNKALITLFPLFMIGMAVWNMLTGGVALGICFAVIGVAYPISYILYFRHSIKQQITKFGLAEAKNFYTCTLSAEGLHVQNDNSEVDWPWEKMFRVFVLDKYVYTYASKQRGFIMPLADLQEGATVEDLMEMLRAHLSKNQLADKRKHKV